MSDVWRIFVVDGDESLNQTIVNALRKDGYVVSGVLNGADAVRVLWAEEYDIVICDLKTPGADGFELLQWLRAYRPNTRMIMVGTADSPALRVQVMESGAVGYLEKPLDLRILKEELRRLLQQSGFTASLDSFDLLDVIQIITMSRKSITLLINTGLEERGTLYFQNGELISAEYGILRGEEAFFALAAHKNGTVTQQLGEEQVTANVTQPLSRLIFQALQYRSKYADRRQYTGEMEAVKQAQPQLMGTQSPSSPNLAFSPDEIDDSPFIFLAEEQQLSTPSEEDLPGVQLQPTMHIESIEQQSDGEVEEQEWWERTGQIGSMQPQEHEIIHETAMASPFAFPVHTDTIENQVPAIREEQQPVEQSIELPSWLMDQPTSSNLAPVHSPAPQARQVPATPQFNTISGEWQTPQSSPFPQTENLPPGQSGSGFENGAHSTSSATWQALLPPHTASYPAMPTSPAPAAEPPPGRSGPLKSLQQSGGINTTDNNLDALDDNNPLLSTASLRAQRLAARRNYAALISALQTLGYSITGFIAAAIVNIDGLPVAQVAIDDLDISQRCRYFSVIQRSVLQTLEQDAEAGDYEEAVITSAGRHILMRALGTDKKAFLVLITTREANPTESLEVMANVEGAISAALR